jgi:O-antigen/teichoic acid export membrane protein
MIETADVEAVTDNTGPEVTVVARQTAIGGSWMVGARLISRVIDLGTMLVLARILTPKDFGLVAIAMTVIFIVEAALELPLSQALVRLPHTTAAHYDTAFTLGFLRGLTLTSIVCLVSWPFARFYADARLLPLVILLSLAPAARGLVSPRLADFSRRLDFSPDFTIEFTGKLAAFLTAIGIAVTFRSYWAIAAGTIVAPVAGSITSYVLAPYRPKFSLAELPTFSGFLGWMTAAQIVSAFNWQMDRLLLGKLTSRSELGLFTAANDTSSVPALALFSPILRPLNSAFSMLRDDPKRLVSSYQASATACITLGLPILLGESLVAYPLVRLMFGEKWMGAAPLLRWLAISLVPTLFAVPLGPLVMALGKTQIFFRRNLFEVTVRIPLVVFGAIRWHFMGVVYARCIAETATICFCMVVVRSLIGLPIKAQLLAPWRSIVAAGVMVVAVALVTPRLTQATATAPLALGMAATVFTGAAVYVGALWALWRATGKPPGLEGMIIGKIGELVRRKPGLVKQEAP